MAEPEPVSPRALLVEDEFVIAMLIESHLHALGVTQVVVAPTLQDGLVAAESGDFDVALLDVQLNNDVSFPIAEVLRRRNIPLAFQTGYGAEGIAARFADCPVLAKPYTLEALRAVLSSLLPDRGFGAEDLHEGRRDRSGGCVG